MDAPGYLRVLWNYKWLLIVGAVVAAIAAFLAGFTLQNGQLVPRAQLTFSATTTMLVTSENARLYQAEVPGIPVQEGVSAPQIANLAESALLYAYILSGDTIQEMVEETTGALDDETEAISGLRRTTQPAGDERFPGRYELPVLEAIGTAETPERAEEISLAAAETFIAYLIAQQDADGIDPAQRVQLEILSENPAVEGDSSNPAIPIVVTFLGVFLGFVMLAFLIAGIRAGAEKRRAAKASAAPDAAADAPADDDTASTALLDDLDLHERVDDTARADELVATGAPTRARARSSRERD